MKWEAVKIGSKAGMILFVPYKGMIERLKGKWKEKNQLVENFTGILKERHIR